MSIEYILLLLAGIGCFFKQKGFSIVMMICSVVAAYALDTINFSGVLGIVFFYAITHFYFQTKNTSKFPANILLAVILVNIYLIIYHLLPGFKNTLVIDKVAISALSAPYSMYLNFDKAIAGIILFLNSGLYNLEQKPDVKSMITTAMSLFLCSVVLMSSGLLSGYIKFDLKIPDILLLWGINNLFFVCFAEEVIFRGVIQNKLAEFISNKYVALLFASLIFGLSHYKDGSTFVLLSSVAGGFYGFTYLKTRRILCSMIVHFGLNLTHLILFTYPAAIRL